MSSIKNLPRVNGRAEVPFGLGIMSRQSVAWSPDSGASHRVNTPRLTDGRIPVFNFKPRVFDTFSEPTEFMDYDASGPNSKFWAGSGGVQETFETNFPEFTKVAMGTSFSGRPIDGYRLGPITGKHFVLVHGVHGNEVDGIDGGRRAVEILARDPLFQNFRDEWTLFYVPVLNPDGWFNGLRNLDEVGPNGRTINLNRQFDWFWDEYTETSFESKGSAPGSTSEASALLSYKAAVDGAGGRFGVVIDFHANRGVGARYQSRDRIYREVLFGPGEGGEVPDNFLTISLDWYIWQIHKSFSTVRTLANPSVPGSDLFVRYFRSRFRPHLHAFMSSLGIFSLAVEEVKVADAGGRETIASACNYRLDYTLAVAAAVTADNWEFKDAVLVENATSNAVVNNPEWTDWQDDSRVSSPSIPEERPRFYSLSRSDVERVTVKEGEKHFDDGSEAVRLTSDLDIELSTPAEFNSATNDGFDSIAVATSYGSVFSIPMERFKAGDILPLVIHTTPFATSVVHAPAVPFLPGPPPAGAPPTKAIDILGGGIAPFTGASSLITRVYTDIADGAVPEERVIETDPPSMGTGFLPRAHAGFADNFLAFPAPGGEKGYVIGGEDSTGTPLTSLGVWDPVALSFTASPTSFLPSGGLVGPVAIFNPSDGLVYIFGGLIGGSPSPVFLTWDPVFDVLVDHTGTIALPKSLAHMAGAFHPGTGKIYLYGGEEASGDMNDEIYEVVPSFAATTITPILITENLDDDENVEVDGEEGAPWARRFGRWTAATLVEDASDGGLIEIIGGKNKDSSIPVDTLVDTVYEHDVDDNTFGLASESSFGYIRFSSAVRREFVNPNDGSEVGLQFEGDFTSGIHAELSDPSSGWVAGTGTAITTGTGGPLKLSGVVPNFNNQRLVVDIRRSGGGTLGESSLVVRSTYTGATLDRGYKLRYDETVPEWVLERVIGGVGTSLITFPATATEIIDGTFKEVSLEVTGRDPVQIVGIVNGTTVANFTDLDTDRIQDIGIVSVEAAPGTANYEIDDYKLLTSGQNEQKWTASIFAKANSDNVSGYVRSTLFPKDDTKTNQFVTRRIRNYYTIPPKILYNWYHSRLDLRDGTGDEVEDGIRYYMRIYKNDQKVLLDGLHIQEGTLITSSYQHPDFPRANEIFTFPDAVNPNAFRLEFYWMTTTNFTDLDQDLEIVRIQGDTGNSISLLAKAGQGNDRFQREYNINDVHGPHDPVFRLQKIGEPCYNVNGYNNGGYNIGPCGNTSEVDVVCYWGYDLRDPSGERQDDTIKFTITHIAGSLLELKVERYGNEGRATSSVNLDAFSDSCASISYRGVGYYSKPEIVDVSDLPNGRKVPTSRRGLIDRIRNLARPQVMVGERDPTSGQIVKDLTFIEGDDFDRADSSSLGSDWDNGGVVFFQTGAGFNILSNKASCTDQGFQRWDHRAQHAAVIITADVTVDNDGDRVGLLARWDTSISDSTLPVNGVTAYSAELEQLTMSSAEVRIIRWYKGDRTTLFATPLSSYTTGETLELKFTLSGASLIAEITGRGIAGASDTNYKKPKRLGIYGQTGGPSQAVTIDNYSVAQNFKSSVS
jgi:hypothetical protein